MSKCSRCKKDIGLFVYTENGEKICEDCFNKSHRTGFHEELSASMLRDLNKAINDQNADNWRTQFAEKEIDSLKNYIILQGLANNYLKEREKQLRHKICEEIRNIAGKYWTRLEDDNEQLVDYYITPKDLDEILEKVVEE